MPAKLSKKNLSFTQTINEAWPPGNPPFSTTVPSVLVTTSREVQNEADNPRFRQQIMQHIDATTPLIAAKRVYKCDGHGTAKASYVMGPGLAYTGTEEWKGIFPFVSSWHGGGGGPDVYKDLVAKIYKKLYSRQQSVQSGVAVVEFRKTLAMIRNPAKGLYQYITGQQFGRYKKRLRQATVVNGRVVPPKKVRASIGKAASDLWLETQFGWKPLLADIDGALKAYSHTLSRVEYEPLEARVKSGPSNPLVVITPGAYSTIAYSITEVRTQRQELQAYGETNNTFYGAVADFGISWGAFVPTVWELLPYSFLVDYFTNVGDVLNGCFVDTAAVNRISLTSKTIGDRRLTFSAFRANGNPNVRSVVGSHPTVLLTDTVLTRSLGMSLSVPSLRLEIPGAGSLKWANLGALVKTLYTGGSMSRFRV